MDADHFFSRDVFSRPTLREALKASLRQTDPEAVRRHRLLQDVERDFGGRGYPFQEVLSAVDLAESPSALDRFVALLVRHGFVQEIDA